MRRCSHRDCSTCGPRPTAGRGADPQAYPTSRAPTPRPSQPPAAEAAAAAGATTAEIAPSSAERRRRRPCGLPASPSWVPTLGLGRTSPGARPFARPRTTPSSRPRCCRCRAARPPTRGVSRRRWSTSTCRPASSPTQPKCRSRCWARGASASGWAAESAPSAADPWPFASRPSSTPWSTVRVRRRRSSWPPRATSAHGRARAEPSTRTERHPETKARC
mmetsp:Transcript_144380/g.462569  ORF Transcript_144380/g.462569 Transcript_144380/m.462569 type:complete len:219 (+) Transcript_144380:509-1165(+)